MTQHVQGKFLTPHRVMTVSAQAMKTMSVLLDDPNPIHIDVAAVRELGMGDRLVNQGPTNLAYVMDMVRKNFPTGRLQQFRSRLLANVFDGDVVTAGGEIQSVAQRAYGTEVTSHVWLDIDGGGRAVEGTASVVIE